MENVDPQPHIRIPKSQMAPVVLVVGDPQRAEMIAENCDSYEPIATNREYFSYACVKDGARFITISHGVGSSGAGICFHELIESGAKVIIRAGTCGTLCKEFRVGDCIIVSGAVREEGTSRLLAPLEYPAVSDFSIYGSLRESAKELKYEIGEGIALSSDAFYQSKVLPSSLEPSSKMNVQVVEMEVSALFVIGRLAKIRTGCILTVDGSPLNQFSHYAPRDDTTVSGVKKMTEIAIRTCVKLTKEF